MRGFALNTAVHQQWHNRVDTFQSMFSTIFFVIKPTWKKGSLLEAFNLLPISVVRLTYFNIPVTTLHIF